MAWRYRSRCTSTSRANPVSTIPGVKWIGEYFGNYMLVNGKVWPYLNVEPRLYQFRVLNRCDAHIMSLDLGGAPIWQIGAEGGMWDRPVRMRQLVLTPAERADVIVDFRGFEGRSLTARNMTPAAPVSTPAPPLPTVMQIRVGTSVTHRGPRDVPRHLPGQRPGYGGRTPPSTSPLTRSCPRQRAGG